jgi:cysteine synthase A
MYKAAFEQLLKPDIFNLRDNLHLVQFKVMKVLPAFNIIKNAYEEEKINDNTLIIDTSSGTFALGLALVCNHFKLNLTIVADPAIDSRLFTRLSDLGVNVIIIREPDDKGNYQKKRLDKVKEIIKENDNVFWCNQYDNDNNQGAYSEVASQIVEEIKGELIVIGPVGSGGSTGGIIKQLKRYNPKHKLVGVDTFKSVLFGLEDGKRDLRGLGNSIIPKNFNIELYDSVHWISAQLAYNWTRDLHKNYGIFSGGTTGAGFGVAKFLSEKYPDKKIVFIGPDDGTRYIDTIYNDSYLLNNGYFELNYLKEPEYRLDQNKIETLDQYNWCYSNYSLRC